MKTRQQRFYQGAVIQQNNTNSYSKKTIIKPYFRTPFSTISGDLTNPYTKTNFTWNITSTSSLRTLINEFNGYLNIDLNTSLPDNTINYLEIEGGIDVLNIKNISTLESLVVFSVSFTSCMLIDLTTMINNYDLGSIRLIENAYCFDYILPNTPNTKSNGLDWDIDIEITRDRLYVDEPDTNIWWGKMEGTHFIQGNIVSNTDKIYVHLPVGSTAIIEFLDYTGQVITLYDYENRPSNDTPLEY